MLVCLQRVARACVTVRSPGPMAEGSGKAAPRAIGRGFLALVGVAQSDQPADAEALAAKVAALRVFPDEAGKMNLSLQDTAGEVLVVSQFTLYADCRRGRRPSFAAAAEPEHGLKLYEHFAGALRRIGIPVTTGVFGAHMQVELVNDGPVTIILEAREGAIV